MTRVAALDTPMQSVAALNGPMMRVAALDEPMSRLAALGSILDRPVLLAGLAVLFLAAWGAVTFFAVKLAILSAARVQPKIGVPLQV